MDGGSEVCEGAVLREREGMGLAVVIQGQVQRVFRRRR